MPTNLSVRTTVVVVTWRGRTRVGAALDALAAQTRRHAVLVIDNASIDGTADVLAAHPSRPEVLRADHNLGFAGALELALPRVGTELVAWLNDDVLVEPGWLAALEDALDADRSAAAAASRLLDAGRSLLSAGTRLTATGHGADLAEAPADGEVFGFCGGATLLRTEVLVRVGGLPSGFFCYYEDTDVSWRLRLAGHRVLSVPDAAGVHDHGASAVHGSATFHHWNERNRLLMLLRCAPLRIALRELVRFTLITLTLPFRSVRSGAPNFQVGLRMRVLAQVLARLPVHMRQRGLITRRSAVSRTSVWHAWAGR
jgi:GT2 family glycosyltransferase